MDVRLHQTEHRTGLREAIVPVKASLRDVLLSLHQSGIGIALIVDNQERLIGTMTDGDVRRALLSNVGLNAPLWEFMQRDFTTVGLQSGRAEVLDLIRARAIRQVPIVDSAGRPIGLHLLQELIGAKVRPNWGVIMAGGKGTRLRPLTEAVPKPMLKVAGRPILERLILHMVGYGIRRIFLSINYLGHIIEQYFGDGARFGCQIEYLREERPLGTAGSLSLLPEAPTEPILVMNGDLVTQTNLGDMLDYHLLGPQVATMGVRRYVHTIPFGCVELEGERVISLVEKPQVERMVNTGIYVLDPKVVARIPRQQECTVPGLLDDCLARNERVYAYELRDDWIDVGQFHQLHQAQSGEGDLPPVEAVVAAPVKQAA